MSNRYYRFKKKASLSKIKILLYQNNTFPIPKQKQKMSLEFIYQKEANL